MILDWRKVRNEYLNGDISYRKLADKHKIPYNTLKDRAIREEWFKKRAERRDKIEAKTAQKTVEVIATKEAERLTRILSASDELLAKIEEATAQLDTHLVTNKVKVRVVSYTHANKPKREVIEETEDKTTVAGPIDRLGLSHLTAALKNLKDVVVAVNDGEDAEGVVIVDDYR